MTPTEISQMSDQLVKAAVKLIPAIESREGLAGCLTAFDDFYARILIAAMPDDKADALESLDTALAAVKTLVVARLGISDGPAARQQVKN